MTKVWTVVLAVTMWMGVGLPARQEKEVRKISTEFSGIELATHGELLVKLGEKVELVVEADEEIIDRIVTEVRGDTLIIRKKERTSHWLQDLFGSRRVKPMRFSLTVLPEQLDHLVASSHGDISVPELKGQRVSVELSSHGEVEIGEIKAERVEIDLSSHGDLRIGKLAAERLRTEMSSHGLVQIRSGQVDSQEINLSSHGDYLAEGLESRDAVVDLSSHGTAKVYATRRLEASITSHGDLYYRGDPELDIPRSQRKHVQTIR